MEKISIEDDLSSSSTTRLLDGEYAGPKRSRSSLGKGRLVLLILNCVLLLVNIPSLAMLYVQRQVVVRPKIPSQVFTDEAIQWELRSFDDVFGAHQSPFRGAPRPELDAAWQRLMRGYDMRVPHPGWAQPTDANFSMVRLVDKSNDGLAVPAMLHQIHCLRTIREAFLPEHYPRTAARYPHPPNEINVHIDHCIDGLRQAAMCHADMTLMSYEWWDKTPYPQVVPGSQHVCANWEQVTTWIQSHRVETLGDILRHPKTGVVPFPSDGADPWPAHNAYWTARGQPWNTGQPDI